MMDSILQCGKNVTQFNLRQHVSSRILIWIKMTHSRQVIPSCLASLAVWSLHPVLIGNGEMPSLV